MRSKDGFPFNLVDVAQIIHVPDDRSTESLFLVGNMVNLVSQVLRPTYRGASGIQPLKAAMLLLLKYPEKERQDSAKHISKSLSIGIMSMPSIPLIRRYRYRRVTDNR